MARSVSFVIDSDVDTRITVTEQSDGTLLFEVEVLDTGLVGDLRGVFFDVAGEPTIVPTDVTGAEVTEVRIQADMIDTLGQDANVKGEVSKASDKFDVGVEFGDSGLGTDDIQSTSFTVSGLSIDDISLQDFALRYTSVGVAGGDRSGSLKILGQATAAPDAVEDSFTTGEDSALAAANVLGNDTDADGDALTVNLVNGDAARVGQPVAVTTSGGRSGEVTIDALGNVSFTPGDGFDSLAAGQTDSFTVTYGITDGNGGADTAATATVTVTGANDAPTLAAGALDASEDGAAVSLDLSAYGADVDADDSGATLGYAITGGPAEGSASITDTTLSFDPGSAFQDLAKGETREVTIQVTATDAHGATAVNDVTVTVTGGNDAPTLAAAALDAAEDGPAATIDLATLGADVDSDNDGSTLSYAITGGPAEGGASITGTTLGFDPGAGFQDLAAGETRDVTIEITATDVHGVTAVNEVTVTVTGVNDDPEAAADFYATDEDTAFTVGLGDSLLFNDSDPDVSDVLTVTAINGLASGIGAPITLASGAVVTLNADGTFGYDPNGAFDGLNSGQSALDSFQYTVSDGKGGSQTATATVTIHGDDDGNLGFEQGDFTGWQTIGSTAVVTSYNTSGGAATTATEGSHFAVMNSTSAASEDQVEAFLGVGSNAIDVITTGTPTNGSAIKTTLEVTAGDTIVFDWYFDAGDYVPYYDNSFFTTVDGTLSKLADVGSVGNYGDSGWHTANVAVTTTGTIEFGFGVVNEGDSGVTSALYIDNLMIV